MFDVFISYSSADAAFVQDLVRRMERRGVSLWFDRAEIKPGDYIRERINKGISDSRYLLAVLSPNSLNSRWVQQEIDAAMIRELSARDVQLIPLLIGAIEPDALPPDLRGKNYLDFREKSQELTELDRLIALLNPEKKKRLEFLKYVRSGMPDRANGVDALQEVVCNYRDQTIQAAAISALQDIGTAKAVIALAHRLLDPWGLGSIRRCLKALHTLSHSGGLCVVGATYFWDRRLYDEKLSMLRGQLGERTSQFDEVLANLTEPDGTVAPSDMLIVLTEATPLEVSAGVTYGSQFWWSPAIAERWLQSATRPSWMPLYPLQRIYEARDYLDMTIPGLAEFLEDNLWCYLPGTSSPQTR